MCLLYQASQVSSVIKHNEQDMLLVNVLKEPP